MSAAKGELVQGITGNPWYYRQFEYEMAMDMEGARGVDGIHIPKLKEGESEAYRLRPAPTDDHAFIREVYDHNVFRQPFAAQRSPAEWDYEFNGRSKESDDRREWLIIETARCERLGYVQYSPWLEDTVLFIVQIELKPGVGYLNLMPSLLRGLWKTAQTTPTWGNLQGKELKSLMLELGRAHPAYQALLGNRIYVHEPYGWYIRVPGWSPFYGIFRLL